MDLRIKLFSVVSVAFMVVCQVAWAQWTEPVPVDEINTSGTESGPSLSHDGLSFYFSREPLGSPDSTRIYVATRPQPFGPFTSVEQVTGLGGGSDDIYAPCISSNNLRLYYTEQVGSSYYIKVSERVSVNDPWPAGINISELSSLGHVQNPNINISADELTILFDGYNLPGGHGGWDIYQATRPDIESSFGNVTNLASINSSSYELHASVTSDGLTVYFRSDRNGSPQIFKATRTSVGEAFGTPEHMPIFDMPGGSSAPFISRDGSSLYFTKYGSGNGDIYVSYWDPNFPDPMAHWTFDEGTGTTAYDSIGTKDGIVDGAAWAIGVLGGALDFNGIEDCVALPDNDPVWLPQNDFALSFWVHFYRAPFGNQEMILDLNYGESGSPSNELGYMIQRRRNTSTAIFGMTTTTNPDDNLYSDEVLLDNKWYHIVAVRNGTTQSLYIDGQLDASRTCSPDPIDFVGGYDDNKVSIGRYTTNPGGPREFLDGLMDEVMIFGQGLSGEEIRQLFERGNARAVAIDIKPGSCPNPLNLRSRGVLSVAVLGTEDFDVNNIDVASIRLVGVSPVRSSFEDVASPVVDGNVCDCTDSDGDGYMDLKLKFKTTEIAEALIGIINDLAKGDQVALALTGLMIDQTPIEGEDCMVIVGKAPQSLRARKSDINEDGIVNIHDFSVMTSNWLVHTHRN